VFRFRLPAPISQKTSRQSDTSSCEVFYGSCTNIGQNYHRTTPGEYSMTNADVDTDEAVDRINQFLRGQLTEADDKSFEPTLEGIRL
jgi:hypothetical protein